jgi:hypothetical protein
MHGIKARLMHSSRAPLSLKKIQRNTRRKTTFVKEESGA